MEKLRAKTLRVCFIPLNLDPDYFFMHLLYFRGNPSLDWIVIAKNVVAKFLSFEKRDKFLIVQNIYRRFLYFFLQQWPSENKILRVSIYRNQIMILLKRNEWYMKHLSEIFIVIRCKDLRRAYEGPVHAYVKASLKNSCGEGVVKRTAVHRATPNPVFRETLILPCPAYNSHCTGHRPTSLDIAVWHRDRRARWACSPRVRERRRKIKRFTTC